MSATERRIRVSANGLADGQADFRTIGEALASLPPDDARESSDAAGGDADENSAGTIISIAAGVYHEKLRVPNRRITLEGAGREATIISWDDHALRTLPSGEPMGTFNSATLYVGGEDFIARNLRIENSAGDGRLVGQAVACYVDADRAAFTDCSFFARQDTLCLGPLPINPLPKGLNPIHPVHIAREGDGERPFRHWFNRCRVVGDIDFIFGSSTALFQACDIVSLDRGEEVNGYITAPSTLPGQRYGFVFIDCRIEGETTVDSVYLGRPWRSSAKAAFLGCEMGRHIAAAGWDNWDKPENEASVEFVEFGSRGSGAPADSRAPSTRAQRARVPWARLLSAEEALRFSPEAVLTGSDGWKPWQSRGALVVQGNSG